MPDTFDPYSEWLGIPPSRRPPTYYDLLGLPTDETDERRIHEAAQDRYDHIRKYTYGPAGPERDQANRVLVELSEALHCLSDPKRRQEYDRRLQAGLEVSVGQDAQEGYDLQQSMRSLLDEELAPAVRPVVGAAAPVSPECPACGASLIPRAVLCVRCGMHLRTGEKLTTFVGDPSATRKKLFIGAGAAGAFLCVVVIVWLIGGLALQHGGEGTVGQGEPDDSRLGGQVDPPRVEPKGQVAGKQQDVPLPEGNGSDDGEEPSQGTSQPARAEEADSSGTGPGVDEQVRLVGQLQAVVCCANEVHLLIVPQVSGRQNLVEALATETGFARKILDYQSTEEAAAQNGWQDSPSGLPQEETTPRRPSRYDSQRGDLVEIRAVKAGPAAIRRQIEPSSQLVELREIARVNDRASSRVVVGQFRDESTMNRGVLESRARVTRLLRVPGSGSKEMLTGDVREYSSSGHVRFTLGGATDRPLLLDVSSLSPETVGELRSRTDYRVTVIASFDGEYDEHTARGRPILDCHQLAFSAADERATAADSAVFPYDAETTEEIGGGSAKQIQTGKTITLSLEKNVQLCTLEADEQPSGGELYVELSGLDSWPVPAAFKRNRSHAGLDGRTITIKPEIPGTEINVKFIRLRDALTLRIEPIYVESAMLRIPLTTVRMARMQEIVPNELAQARARAAFLSESLPRLYRSRGDLMTPAQIVNLEREIARQERELRGLQRKGPTLVARAQALPALADLVESLHNSAKLRYRVFAKGPGDE